jgi:hypothetical protein
MGASTVLYLNAKWELRDIIKVIERTQKGKVKIESQNDSLIGCYFFIINNRLIFVSTNSGTPIGKATYLSLGQNDEAVEIFRDIANVFGGLLIANDCGDDVKMITGKLSQEDGIPYFAQHLFITKDLDIQNYRGFIDGVNEWHRAIDHKPNYDVLKP